MAGSHHYQPLGRAGVEIRVLTVLEHPDTARTDLVHCRLEHVSLDDYSAEFTDFFAAGRWQPDDNGGTFAWLQHELGPPPPDVSRASPISIPFWRGDIDRISWHDLAAILGTGRVCAPEMKAPVLQEIDWDAEAKWLATSAKMRGNFSIKPRYRWGDFEAVSYCWESDEREREIILDGHLFPVPRNLDAVLRKVQGLPEVRSGMKIWIDALCIDQDNVLEKNHQVELMQSIYKRALSTIIWLGESTADSDHAIDYMISIAQIQDQGNVPDSWGKQSFEKWFDRCPWTAIFSLLSRNYWRRLWIIQELALSDRMTLFLCGDRQLSRRIVLMTAGFCLSYGNRIDRARGAEWDDSRGIFAVADHVERLISLREQQVASSDSIPPVVLQLGQSAHAKYPRDKVYGLLGLIPRVVAGEITPDFTLPLVDVYGQMFRALMKVSKNLDTALSWCSFDPATRRHIQWLMRRDASRGHPSSWSISEGGLKLKSRGFIVDVIRSTSSAPSESLPYKTAGPSSPSQDGGKPEENRYGTKDAISMALQRTMLFDHPSKTIIRPALDQTSSTLFTSIYWIDWDIVNGADPSEPQLMHLWRDMKVITSTDRWPGFDSFRQTNADFSVFGHAFRDFFPDMRHYLPRFSVVGSHFEDVLPADGLPVRPEPNLWPWVEGGNDAASEPLTESVAENMKLCALTLAGRRLATTATGYLGLAPEAARAGDFVAVLYGCRYPVVLRSRGDGYQVVGECYVDGLMDGEAILDRERGIYQEVDLVLC